MKKYQEFHRRSIAERDAFWREEARSIDWQSPFGATLEYARPPFARWFPCGRTNLCHNAVDRHLALRSEQTALIALTPASGAARTYTFRELAIEVNQCAAVLKALGVGRGDRVVIFMPTIAETVFAMLACTRIGAIHAVIYSGLSATCLAARIDDARPKVLITADAALREGKVVPCKPVVDAALRVAKRPPGKVVVVDRGLDPALELLSGRDHDYAALRSAQLAIQVPCEWMDSSEPSHILYTSGNAGKPKGIQRDTGGYGVALASSMRHIFCVDPGETMFTSSDIGCSPTELRLLQQRSDARPVRHAVPSLAYVFVTGEPLDEATARWGAEDFGVPIIDTYLQTETGWPVLAAQPGIEGTTIRPGSRSFPVYGYDVRLLAEANGKETPAGSKGVLVIKPPLPPGCGSTIWNDDQRFIQTYYADFPQEWAYSTCDWAVRDSDGYYAILGRTDDVISVGGRRVDTREIEEAMHAHPGVAEAAVVGVPDPMRGQVAVAFAVPSDPAILGDADRAGTFAGEILEAVEHRLGAVARPEALHFVAQLPRTRSGKLLRRSVKALVEGREPGDIDALGDPSALEPIRSALRVK